MTSKNMGSGNEDEMYIIYKNAHNMLKYREYTPVDGEMAMGNFGKQFMSDTYIIIRGKSKDGKELAILIYARGSKYLKGVNAESFEEKHITGHTVCVTDDVKQRKTILSNAPTEQLPNGTTRYKYPIEFGLYSNFIYMLPLHKSMFVKYYLEPAEEVSKFEKNEHRKITMLQKVLNTDPCTLWSGLQTFTGHVIGYNALSDTAGEAYRHKIIVKASI